MYANGMSARELLGVPWLQLNLVSSAKHGSLELLSTHASLHLDIVLHLEPGS